jgi:hypothetical protein
VGDASFVQIFVLVFVFLASLSSSWLSRVVWFLSIVRHESVRHQHRVKV